MAKKIIGSFVTFFVICALALTGCGEISERGADGNPDPVGQTDPDPVEQTGSDNVWSVLLASTSNVLVANGESRTALRVLVGNELDFPLADKTVNFTTTAGTLSAASAQTDSTGFAEVFLTAPTYLTTASVIASIDGFNPSAQVEFISGAPSPENSSLIANPVSLLADGESESEVTVVLRDAHGNPVSGELLILTSSAGLVRSSDAETDRFGSARFTVVAPSSPGQAELKLQRPYDSITGSMTFGVQTSGDAVNIILDSSTSQVAIAGVGQPETLNFSARVVDVMGHPVQDAPLGVNNLRVRFLAQPGSGEKIVGTNAAGTSVHTTGSDWALVRTVGGQSDFFMHSGTLPGVVEIEVEALDSEGTPYVPPVRGIISQLSIASGPPHTIVLTYPQSDSIENLGGGTYRRVGNAIVTDRYGNAVPDGTNINLGLIDSIIASGNTGTIPLSRTSLMDSTRTGANAFDQLFITRNNVARTIQRNDRVLLFNASAQDKSRFVELSPSAQTLQVQKNYSASGDGFMYAVGASMLGGLISGVNEAGTTVPGTATTVGGVATVYVTYPANLDTIGVGCLGYATPGDITAYVGDQRFAQPMSAQVMVVASSSDDSATTIDAGRLCFAHIRNETFDYVSGQELTGNGTITLRLRDGGDGIPLPFKHIAVSLFYVSASEGFEVIVGQATTGGDGVAHFPVTVIGGALGNSASVTFRYNDAEATVIVRPRL